MLASSPAVPLALLLLVGTPAAAQPRAIPCEAGTRRIELKTEPTFEVPELCIGPGLSTTLLFYGAELLPGGITVEGRERFTMVEVSSTMLRLVPSERVLPGDRFRVTVRFKDGAAPSSATFWLGVYPGQVEPFVEVYRERRTVESYQQEVEQKDAQLRQCQKDNERLYAEQEVPGGLAGLLSTGLVNETGITSTDLTKSIGRHPRNVVHVGRVFSYRSTSRVAVELRLEFTQELQSWRALRAELVGPGRRRLQVNPPWLTEPIRFDAKNPRLVIEAEATEAETRGGFTLTVWNEEGTRILLLTGVTFP